MKASTLVVFFIFSLILFLCFVSCSSSASFALLPSTFCIIFLSFFPFCKKRQRIADVDTCRAGDLCCCCCCFFTAVVDVSRCKFWWERASKGSIVIKDRPMTSEWEGECARYFVIRLTSRYDRSSSRPSRARPRDFFLHILSHIARCPLLSHKYRVIGRERERASFQSQSQSVPSSAVSNCKLTILMQLSFSFADWLRETIYLSVQQQQSEEKKEEMNWWDSLEGRRRRRSFFTVWLSLSACVWMRMTVASTIADFANRMGGQDSSSVVRCLWRDVCALSSREWLNLGSHSLGSWVLFLFFSFSSFPLFLSPKGNGPILSLLLLLFNLRKREKCANLDSHWESTGEREECANFVKWHFCVHYFFSLSFLLLLSRFYCWLLCLCLMCVCLVLSFYFFSFFFFSQPICDQFFLSIFSCELCANSSSSSSR